jgi:hypothetical protein
MTIKISSKDFRGSTGGQVYIGLVTVGGVYGAYRGFWNWWEWTGKRERIALNSSLSLIEPIVNIGVDAGKLGLDMGAGALAGATMTATAPVSIPLAVHFGKKNEQDTN